MVRAPRSSGGRQLIARACGPLLWLLVCLVAPAIANAQQTTLRTSGCDLETETAVRTALAIELSGASDDARLSLERRGADLECRADGATVRFGGVEQRIEPGPGHTRRLALAVVELLEAHTAPIPPMPPHRTLAWIDAGAGVWIGGAPILALGTAHVGAEIVVIPALAIRVALSGSFGSQDVHTGIIDLRLLSIGLSIGLGGELGPWILRTGPALRAGAALWSGRSRAPDVIGRDAVGGWLGLGAIASAAIRLGEAPVRLGLELEGGGIAVSSRAIADGRLGASIAEGWLEARIIAGIAIE